MRKRACAQKRYRKHPQHTRRKPPYARDSSVRSRVARPQTRAPQGAAPRRGLEVPGCGRFKGIQEILKRAKGEIEIPPPS